MIKAIGLVSPVIVPLIVAGILFFSSGRNDRPRLFLAIYMIIIAFIFLANYYYFEHKYNVYIWLHSLHIATVLAIYPGAYIYIRLLAGGKKDSRLLIHLLPSMIFLILSAGIFFPFLNTEERMIFLTEYRYHPDFSEFWMKILYYVRMANIAFLFLQVFIYVFLTWRILVKHRSIVSDIFSNPEKFQLNWLKVFNLALALSAFICVFMYTINPEKLFGDERYLSYPLLMIAVILWFLGIMGNNQKEIVVLEEEPTEYLPEPEGLFKNLLEYFEKEEPYLNPDLSIYDVAAYLGTNRTYVSQMINSRMHQNFSSFVNRYRLEESCNIIRERPDVMIAEIAEETGFGSVSSLIRCFQKEKGESISSFKKRVGNMRNIEV